LRKPNKRRYGINFPEYRNSLKGLTALGIQQVDSFTATDSFLTGYNCTVFTGKEL